MNSFNLNFQGLEYIGMISIPILVNLLSIIGEFILYRKRIISKISVKSWIYIGTLVFFFLLYIQMIRFDILELKPLLPEWMSYIGVILVYLGCLLNITVRFHRYRIWKNHIRKNNELKPITTGLHAFIRQPLDVTLFVILFGVALIFSNLACFLLLIFILIPFKMAMFKQEEENLIKRYPEYELYKQKTGLYLPRFKK